MQGSGQVAGRQAGAPHHKGGGKRKLAHSAADKTGSGAEQGSPGFLTQRLPFLGLSKLEYDLPCGGGKRGDYLTAANYRSLRASAENYARLVGKPLDHVPGGNFGAGIADLYFKLMALEPDINLNIGTDEGRLHFVFWDTYNFPGYTLFWLRIDFLEKLSGGMRAAAVAFLRLLKEKTGMETTNDSWDVQSVVEYLRECAWEADDPQDRELDEGYADSYSEGGSAYGLMEELLAESGGADRVFGLLSKARTRDEEGKKLLALMREGTALLSGITVPLFSYRYDPYGCDDGTERVMEMERLMRFTYADDRVSEELEQMLNGEFECGSYEESLSETLILTPDTEQRFSKKTAPDELLLFLEKFLDFLNGYLS